MPSTRAAKDERRPIPKAVVRDGGERPGEVVRTCRPGRERVVKIDCPILIPGESTSTLSEERETNPLHRRPSSLEVVLRLHYLECSSTARRPRPSHSAEQEECIKSKSKSYSYTLSSISSQRAQAGSAAEVSCPLLSKL